MSTTPVLVQSLINAVWDNNVAVYAWQGLAANQTGLPLGGPGFSDRSVQIEGTPGAGFTIVIEGSNDGVNYHTLHDPFNNVLSFTSVGVLAQVTEITLFIRPSIAGGDGTTNVTVTMVPCNHMRN
jgi:hypothetical protein